MNSIVLLCSDAEISEDQGYPSPLKRRQPPTIPSRLSPINTLMTDRYTEQMKLRETLIDEIRADVEYEIDDLLEGASESLTEEDRKAIRDEVLAQASCVTNALTTKELQNEGARRAYTCGTTATISQLINSRLAQLKKS